MNEWIFTRGKYLASHVWRIVVNDELWDYFDVRFKFSPCRPFNSIIYQWRIKAIIWGGVTWISVGLISRLRGLAVSDCGPLEGEILFVAPNILDIFSTISVCHHIWNCVKFAIELSCESNLALRLNNWWASTLAYHFFLCICWISWCHDQHHAVLSTRKLNICIPHKGFVVSGFGNIISGDHLISIQLTVLPQL